MALAFGLVTAALIAGLASEPASAASVVGPNGQISGCYKKKGKAKGTVRVVPAGKRCRRGEKPISWNSQGPQGQGVTGSAGDPGLQSQVTELQSQVSQLTSQVTALTSELSGLTDQVTALSTTVDSLCSELTTVVTQTNGILTGLGAPSLTGTLFSLVPGATLNLSFPSLPSALSPFSCP